MNTAYFYTQLTAREVSLGTMHDVGATQERTGQDFQKIIFR